jgi:hypothetical protein
MKTKNLFLSAASIAMLASCSSELDIPAEVGSRSLVTLTAQLPGNLSRAFGDGKQVKFLKYAVYEENATTPLAVHTGDSLYATKVIGANDMSVSIQLQLVEGKKYDVVFWADYQGSPYKFNPEGATITVDYTDISANSESLDAFYGHETLEVKGAVSKSISLYRPFAQINIGTNDWDQAKAAGYEVTQSAVTVTDVNTKLNLLTGRVAGESTDVTFGMGNIAASDNNSGDFPAGTDYKYLVMNYILVGAERATTSVTLSVSDGNSSRESTFTGVPVQANYRTNIYGALLTNAVDYTVTIDNKFGGDDINIDIWDGVTKTEPKYDEEKKAYVISSPNEFAYFLAGGASTSRSTSTVTNRFELNADLDMGGCVLPTRGDGATAVWDIELIGNNHTISNFACAVYGKENSNVQYSAVFPIVSRFKASDVTFRGATIGSTDIVEGKEIYAGVVVGYSNVARFENVTVEDCVVNGVQKVGGILGFQGGNCVEMTGCTVRNTTINGNGSDCGSLGGVLGSANVNVSSDSDRYTILKDILVEGVTLNAPEGVAEVKRGNGYIIGTVVAAMTVTLENCVLGTGNSMVSNYTANQYIGGDRSNGKATITINGTLMSELDQH